MQSIHNIKNIFLLGIGGIGMSALARYFKAAGNRVCGYDKTPTELTDELIAEGIPVHFKDDVAFLPDFLSGMGINPEALIIYTPAIPKDHKEYNHLIECGYRMWKRSEVLGLITSEATTIAVAGAHGKTTTSTMIAHILKASGVDCTAFLGGISKNYNTNLLLSRRAGDQKEVVVVEADEFDRSFLTLHPDIAVITSMDADHLDIYGNHDEMIASYKEFASQVTENGTLVYRSGLPLDHINRKKYTYALEIASDFKAENIRIENYIYVFDISNGDTKYTNIRLTWPGRHNVENATGAFAACLLFGMSSDAIKGAIESFEGVKRRFDYQIRAERITMIDDYAHHPEELRATIQSVKELYKGKKVLGIFQPHLYSRTRDFAEGFGTSLSMLDELILMDIYPARELPIPGVTSEMILSKVQIPQKQVCPRAMVIEKVMNSDAEVILTLGAGDIDQLVQPIKESLVKKYLKQTAQ